MTPTPNPPSPPPPRPRADRRRDTLHRLDHDVDAWVATAGVAPDGTATPWLVPLSFRWDGTALLVATPEASPTGRNLRATGTARVSLGLTRDVVVLDVTADVRPVAAVPAAEADAFAARAGFDPRASTTPYVYARLTPHRIQAWREENELAGRLLMRSSRWLPG
jgi:hypothetical protein